MGWKSATEKRRKKKQRCRLFFFFFLKSKKSSCLLLSLVYNWRRRERERAFVRRKSPDIVFFFFLMGRTVACYVSLCVYVCDLLFLWLKLDGSFCLFIKVSTRKQNSVFFFLSREKKKTVRVFYSISRVGSSFFSSSPIPHPFR